MRKRALTAAGTAVALLAAAGCSGADDKAGGGAENRTMVVAASSVPAGFDGDVLQPGSQAAVTQLNEPLVDFAASEPNESGARQVQGDKVEPRLAESWETSADGLTYTFSLRQGVKSARGNTLTADDVKWSWDKSIAQKRTGNFIATATNVKSIEVVDPQHVKFTLSAPSPVFLRALALYVPNIYDSTEMKKHATAADPWALEWLKTNHAGFGAYQLESLQAGTQAVFTANPNFYRGQPYFTKVIYREVPDSSNRVQLLQRGEVDWIEDPTPKQLQDLAAVKSVKVRSVVGNLQVRALMNPNFPPFDNPLVRQAVNHAVDRDAIKNAVFYGFGQAPTGSVPPGFQCATNVPLYDTNFDKAKQLMTQAGFPNGVDVELTYSDYNVWDEALSVQLKASLEKVGIRASLKKIPSADMLARSAIGKRDLPFFVLFEQTQIPDAGYSLALSSVPTGSADRNNYNNPQLVDLVKRANATTDESVRCGLLEQAQKLHMQDATWANVWLPGAYGVMKSDIQGWVWHAEQQPRWHDLKRG
ncbi:ABC transporter substrate-binding protein [Dactylosporangium sp. NPDC050688]|uniref:ABC transporter substrate-binding protein n=1 Tax=Dactylosporangium sp. NPDC050688 TaxID=3157217 RepID=UPI0033F93D4B